MVVPSFEFYKKASVAMRWLLKKLMAFFGWKIEGHKPDYRKFVLVAAPHTSNWDFVIAVITFYILRIKGKFTIKKELFFFPLGILLKALGGYPINRQQNNSGTVEQMVEEFNKRDELVFLVTPEGTRSSNQNWKKGFYYLALAAKVPVVLGYADYKKKVAGIGPIVFPTGNLNEDIEKMKNFYRDKKGRFPNQGVK